MLGTSAPALDNHISNILQMLTQARDVLGAVMRLRLICVLLHRPILVGRTLSNGLVVKALDKDGKAPIDFSPLLAGIIRVDLAEDFGYQEIVDNLTASNKLRGAGHIGVGT